MAPFDTYDLLLVCHCKYSSIFAIFELFDVLNDIVALKSGLEIIQCH